MICFSHFYKKRWQSFSNFATLTPFRMLLAIRLFAILPIAFLMMAHSCQPSANASVTIQTRDTIFNAIYYGYYFDDDYYAGLGLIPKAAYLDTVFLFQKGNAVILKSRQFLGGEADTVVTGEFRVLYFEPNGDSAYFLHNIKLNSCKRVEKAEYVRKFLFGFQELRNLGKDFRLEPLPIFDSGPVKKWCYVRKEVPKIILGDIEGYFDSVILTVSSAYNVSAISKKMGFNPSLVPGFSAIDSGLVIDVVKCGPGFQSKLLKRDVKGSIASDKLVFGSTATDGYIDSLFLKVEQVIAARKRN